MSAKNPNFPIKCNFKTIVKCYVIRSFASACTTASDKTMKGTCYTASECAGKGGTSGGNCAAGNSSQTRF
jgi:hypothetical protein